MLLDERIIPAGIMARSQVTLDIAQDLLSHSLFVRLILWSADAGRNRDLLISHSFGVKIILRRTTFSTPVNERKMNVTC